MPFRISFISAGCIKNIISMSYKPNSITGFQFISFGLRTPKSLNLLGDLYEEMKNFFRICFEQTIFLFPNLGGDWGSLSIESDCDAFDTHEWEFDFCVFK